MLRLASLIFLTLALAASTSLLAQEAVSTPRYQWIATPCDTWGCAVSAIASANGEPTVLMLPTKSSDHPWVVLRRVISGSMELPDGPFTVETFSGMLDASSRFMAIDSLNVPMLITTTDGGMLVISLREPNTKKRAVRP